MKAGYHNHIYDCLKYIDEICYSQGDAGMEFIHDATSGAQDKTPISDSLGVGFSVA